MRKALFYILALLMILPCSCINEETPNREDVVVVGDLLPDFSVEMNDGSTVTAAQLRESHSVVMFFHSSCPDCRKALPCVQQLYDEFVGQGVQFALISREEESISISEYWQANGYTMPYSAQKDRVVYELFATSRVPRIYISDNNGRIRAIFTDNPVPTYEELVEALTNVL